jgi:acid phosphatase (class A)
MNSLALPRLWLRAIAVIAIAAGTFSVALAKDATLHYLKDGKPDAATLLSPPPLPDSAEALADLNEVREVYHAASTADQAAAYAEKSFTVFNYADAVGQFFTPTNLPKTAAFFAKVQSDAAKVTDTGKDFFARPRPFTTDPSLANGKLEKSFSYPSGHSTESMVLALVLADLLPEKHDAILAHARQIGWHRVQIARHYPTDIYAGRTLALAIVKQFKKSDAFQTDFDAAKAELRAAAKP